MKLIVDTNVLMSAMIRDSVAREIIVKYNLDLFTPDFISEEINKNLAYISRRNSLTMDENRNIMRILFDYINVVDFNFYIHKIPAAEKIIGKIHKVDVPFIALALSFNNDGIWTNDKHFLKQKAVTVWSTEDILAKL